MIGTQERQKAFSERSKQKQGLNTEKVATCKTSSSVH